MSEPAMARAIELDPTMSQVQAALAIHKTWTEWQWEEAEVAFLSALERDPIDSATRAYYAMLLVYLGRIPEAEEQATTAAELDPINPRVQGLYAQYLITRREYEEAERVLLRAIEREQDLPYLLSTLRTTYHLMGREQEALANWRASFTDEGAYTTEGDDEALAALDRGYAEDGYSGALRSVAEVYVTRSETEHVAPWNIGTLYTRASMKDEALHYLTLACAVGKNQNCPSVIVEPTFDFLRDDPRFDAIINALGLPG